MVAEVSIHPRVGRDIRCEVTGAPEEIARAGLRHEVEPFGMAVEGDLLAALRGIHGRLSTEGINRVEVHVRLRQEPGDAIERETACFRERHAGVAGIEEVPGLQS
jgi:uncharacterized protein YqgV (UPF0045/DUF77 family)